MGWICTRKMKIKRGGEYIWLRGGDPVPEAEHFPNKKALERLHFIRRVKDPTPPPSPEAEPAPVDVTPQPAPELPLEGPKPTPKDVGDGPGEKGGFRKKDPKKKKRKDR